MLGLLPGNLQSARSILTNGSRCFSRCLLVQVPQCLFPSAPVSGCGVRSAFFLGAVTPKCRLSSALSSEFYIFSSNFTYFGGPEDTIAGVLLAFLDNSHFCLILIVTSFTIDKMFEVYTFFENRTEIRTFFKNRTKICILFKNRFEIYSYILFENGTENFEHFVNGR